MNVSARVRVTGPLVTYVEGFGARLKALGYTDLSLANQLRLVANLSRWLDDGGNGATDITPEVVERFLAERRLTHTSFLSLRGLAPLLRYLRSVGVIPEAVPAEAPQSELLRDYDRYLAEERAILPARRRGYVSIADEFLGRRQIAALSAKDVTEYVRAHAGCTGLAERLTALRALLRFLFLRGDTQLNLVHAVPSASHRRQTSLPKGLEKAEADAMLATCDRRTTVGRRNYAALLLMVRLGLRAGEVAALVLEDIDWEAGVVVVHGKGGSTGWLPLPADVGEAIVSYLRRRPQRVDTRSLLLRVHAPHCGGTAGMVTMIARCALRAAGISSGGSHRLRHTAATQMLRRGASLTEIAQVLRHRHIDTTAIYAKVDRDRLRKLARPWPAGYAIDHDRLCELAQPWPGGAA